jgi:hypothetical protein
MARVRDVDGGDPPDTGRGWKRPLLLTGIVAAAVLGAGCIGAVHVLAGPPAPLHDAQGRIRPDPRLQPVSLPSATLPGVSFKRLVTSLHDITGVHTTYSPELVWDGLDEQVSDGGRTVLRVSARAARPHDGANSGSCRYLDLDSQIAVDATMVGVVRACALAALPPDQDSAAIAWLQTDRSLTQTQKFGKVWVTAYHSAAEYGVLVVAQ